MDLTRREFLGVTAGAVGMVAVPQQRLTAAEPRSEPFGRRWTLYTDPDNYYYEHGYYCYDYDSESESARGYRSALPVERWEGDCVGIPDSFAPVTLLIAPYVVSLLPAYSDCLTDALQHGATAILESGAGFADHCTFRQHRRWLRETLAIRVVQPRDPWASQSRPSARYVEFTWPCRLKIRDFTRVVAPAEGQPGEIIAWAGDLAVGLRRRVGKGTLIYLGSPIGPALWAGDLEAKRWLYAVAHAA